VDIPSRRLAAEDYSHVRAVWEARYTKVQKWPDHKKWFDNIDVDQGLEFIFSHENAYVIDEAFLLVYEIGSPWYNNNVTYLSELTVIRIGPGGSLATVVAFMDAKAKEAGAKLVGVGTALSRTDAALASEYIKLGFRPETTLLVKEPA
jgi:hypothetical protein